MTQLARTIDGGAFGWTPIPYADFSAASKTSATTLNNFSDTSKFLVGFPYRVKGPGDSDWKYMRCVSNNSGFVSFAGEEITDVPQAIAECHIGTPSMLMAMPLLVEGSFDGGSTVADLMDSSPIPLVQWLFPESKILDIRAQVSSQDTGATRPAINLHIGGAASDVFTSDLSVGVTPASSGVASSPAENTVSYLDSLQVPMNVVGTNGDSSDLLVTVMALILGE